MAVKIDNQQAVANWCLADWLICFLPRGTYYLTLAVDWNGPKEGEPHIALIKKMTDGSLSGMFIEAPTDSSGLISFARSHGFSPTDERLQVFILEK